MNFTIITAAYPFTNQGVWLRHFLDPCSFRDWHRVYLYLGSNYLDGLYAPADFLEINLPPHQTQDKPKYHGLCTSAADLID